MHTEWYDIKLHGSFSNSRRPIQDNCCFLVTIKIASVLAQLINSEAIMHEHFNSVSYKEIVTESLTVTDMTAVNSAVLFRSEKSALVSTPMNFLKGELQRENK